MKKFIILFILLATVSLNAVGKIEEDCTYKGIRLYGKVRIVYAGENLKVRIANAGEDLRVQTVNAGANSCGKWEFVTFGEDYKILFVDAGEDFVIRFDTANPGR